MKGKIAKIIAERGYGFIRADDTEADVFFHCTALQDRTKFETLYVGQRVTFDLCDGRNGKPCAESIQLD